MLASPGIYLACGFLGLRFALIDMLIPFGFFDTFKL